ncbi:threonine aldolase family protein [Tropicibacter oceani]|uniref:Beta-eliminating lyase-related protein n=1 Tax=Tropicibacter oceani TaxID=3058420 RepID=A0ABY8QKE9_9RHOB|nr:beta-eliminating lyase-related protein [Tropicibacter oceani]WGW05004.1 beta-eliminating lyase-related protein [Tropicibacter oceani]
MNFASDNGGPVPTQVLDALARANEGYAPGYGSDPLTSEVCDQIRELFEAPEAAVYLVGLGTAANVLALATLVQPYDTVFCSPDAHIHMDECNAPEFYTGGAKLTLVPGSDVMTPQALRTAIEGEENRGVHGPQRGAVSITNVTEGGNVYALDQMRALCDVARDFHLPVHLDGARFANACVALGCTPAEMTWKLGVDVAVFGGTKNGLMGVEAVIFFDPKHAREFELRRKRGAQLYSKHRYLAAQMQAYLQGDLWSKLALRANTAGQRLRAGLQRLGLEIVNETQANMVFFRAPLGLHRAVMAQGAVYHLWGADQGGDDTVVTARLVCDWSICERDVDRFLSLVAAQVQA